LKVVEVSCGRRQEVRALMGRSREEDMQERTLFAEAFLVHDPLIKRLGLGLYESAREFKHDPVRFTLDSIKGAGVGGRRRQALFRLGLAIGLLVYATVFLTIVVLWSFGARKPAVPGDRLVKIFLPSIGGAVRAPVEGPKSEKESRGGGGGGNKSSEPPSAGQPPPGSLVPPVIAPTTIPQLRAPELPVAETLLVDPRLLPASKEDLVTGMPDGAAEAPSDGPGSDHGIGNGREGGMGNGTGKGFRDGQGWNIGGPGTPTIGGNPHTTNHISVDATPVPLNRPRPNYTEAARKNKVQGLVRTRVLVGTDGSVQRVAVTRGLPDGLDEEAIRAAYQMRFRPATKNGQPIVWWVTVEIEFNLR
jgi:TonB family protein